MNAEAESVTAVITAMTDGERRFLDAAVDAAIADPAVRQIVLCVEQGNSWVRAYPGVEIVRLPMMLAGAARNRGVDRAHGQWIAFCDGDDVWRPGKTEVQLRYAKRRDAEIVGCCHDLMDESGCTRAAGLALRVPMTSSWLVRRTVLARVRFSETLSCAEDNDWWERTAQFTRVRCPSRLLNYRVRADSLSAGVSSKDRKQWVVDAARHAVLGPLIALASWIRWCAWSWKTTF
ncbi:MAG: glycosyltransferase family A protein [Planctomycetota bacterium]